MALLFRSIGQQISKQLLSKSGLPCKRCASTAAGLDLRYRDDFAIITMKNKDNRMNAQFLKDFNSLLDDIEENQQCRGLITTGEGKFYSNGIDLAWLKDVSGDEVVSFMHGLNGFFRRILLFPLPTLALMNGHAFAGGAMMASAHDLRTMNSDKGWMCFNEVLLGIRLSEFMMSYLRLKLGGGKNLGDAVALGFRYTAQEALDGGLTHGASPFASIEDDSIQMLKTTLGKTGLPRNGLAVFKQHIYEDADNAFKAEVAENYEKFCLQFMSDSQKASYTRK